MSKYKDKIQLIFGGDGPLKNKYIKWGKKLPNQPILKFFKRDELIKTLNYCDLYVHPSDIEIEAIACIEAITCGLVPVISDSKESATPQFALDDRALFKAGDAEDLAKKIDYWLDNPKINEKEQKNYLEMAKKYEIDHCITKMIEMFKEAIEDFKNKKND